MQVDYSKTLIQATAHIKAHDSILAKVIAATGPCTLIPHTNHYQSLVSAIIGQQLSVQAAAAIQARFIAAFNDSFPMPQDIIAASSDSLRIVGLSRAKISYIKDIAQHIMDGRLEINKLSELSNQQVIDELIAIKGVGLWTAHMFLIFSLGRLDILPVGDLGIRSGIMRLYNLSVLPDSAGVQAIALKYNWHPYESVASWYIWRSLDNKPAID